MFTPNTDALAYIIHLGYTTVEIDVTDKSPFFIRSYHVKEEGKNILDKENEKIMLFRYI